MIRLQQGAVDAINSEIEKAVERFNGDIVRELSIIGTKATTRAREVVVQNGVAAAGWMPYKVDTSNLVSSTGYAITYNGQIIDMSDFSPVGGPNGDGAEGSQKGRAYVRQLAAMFPQGYSLILVAGMHYASYVQELYHRDVLVSGELLAEKLVNDLQNKLKRQ